MSLLLPAGCVQRSLEITSEPPGALVYLNFEEVGRTPLRTDFTFYGNYDVEVRKEGYETIAGGRKVNAPWWQYPPIDLFAEFAPWKPMDLRQLHFELEPTSPGDVDPQAIVRRGNELATQLPQGATPAAATRPQPATP